MTMSEFSGRTMVHDYQLTTIGNALKYYGYSFNSIDPKELADAEKLLLDAKPPKGAERPGGLGSPFDWDLLKALDPDIGFMLSGGLTPDTVADAIKKVRPMGVDVSSGVETAPGEKDAGLIRSFIERARAAARD